MAGSARTRVAVAAAAVGAGCIGYLAFSHARAHLRRRWQQAILCEYKLICEAPLEKLKSVVHAFVVEMHAGLATANGSRLKMLPTFVERLPCGDEYGEFYALDLGGTNFRVMRVALGEESGHVEAVDSKECSIPPEAMTGGADDLFSFIADAFAGFVEERGFKMSPDAALGFCFSFPLEQSKLDEGRLITWTKGFTTEGVEGRDVVALLDSALKRRGVAIKVSALVNDTTGTLATVSYEDPDAVIGVILATGSNACYVEKADRIAKWEAPLPSSNAMVINIEWGDFASAALPRTDADIAVDEISVNPGEQLYEKLMSGMYMGEVARNMLLRLAVDGALFGGRVPAVLREQGGLPTPRLAAIDGDEGGGGEEGLGEARAWLRETVGEGEACCGDDACRAVKEVCALVRTRAAALAACGIAAVLRKIGRDGQITPMRRTVVAVDGALYEKYGRFREGVVATLGQLLGESASKKLELVLANDGSGVGAALLAAAHTHHHLQF